MTRRPLTVLMPALMSALLLSGCSWLYGDGGLVRDTSNDYKKATEGQALKVPDAYRQFSTTRDFVVPSPSANAPGAAETDPRPPALVLSTADGIFAQQEAVVPSAIIVADEAVFWERLSAFFNKHQIGLRSMAREQGLVETDWVATEEAGWWDRWVAGVDEHAWRWNYRFSIKPGERPNERLLSVVALAAEADDGDGWKARSVERRHSVDMLNRFLGYYDTEINRAARERVMASRAGIKIDLWQNEEGQAALLARSNLDNTWESTPDVLGTLGFRLEDKDTTKRLYYFKLEDTTGGFWSKLAFWSDDEEEYEIRIDLPKGEYLVQLAPVGDNTSLLISRADGEALKSDELAKVYPTLATAFQERRPQRLLETQRR